jgi:hypothetical protein
MIAALRAAIASALRMWRTALASQSLDVGEPFGGTPEARALWQASQCLRRMSPHREPPRC